MGSSSGKVLNSSLLTGVIFLCVQALFTEMMVYYKLKKYWGKHVPMLVSHGTTAGRKVVYIATQLIYGHALGIGRLHDGLASTLSVISLFEASSSLVSY